MKTAMKKKWKVAADGLLTFRCLNLLCGIFLLAIAIVLHIHMKLIEKEEEEQAGGKYEKFEIKGCQSIS